MSGDARTGQGAAPDMAPARAVAVLDGVAKRFAGTRGGAAAALQNIDLQIRPGRVTGLVGPDGAGKTTLLRLIAGLLLPDAGRIEVMGHDTVRAPEAARQSLGYMPQRFGLYEDLTVAENLQLHADLHDLPAAERAPVFARLLDFTGLAPFTGRLAGRLSGGMKQKLGLACVLIRRPALLLLDEPTVGVDPVSRRDLWRMVQTLLAEGTAIVWATGYLDEAERCAEVVLLDEGRLLYAGPPADLAGQVAGRSFRLSGIAGDRRAVQARAARLPGVQDALILGAELRLVLHPGAVPPDPAAVGARGARLEPAAPRLEDAFVGLLSARRGDEAPARLQTRATDLPADRPAIEVRGLSRRFGAFLATDDVSFQVGRGEIFGLLGPNGAGKSTTFRMLCGLLPPSAGTALVAGVDLGRSAAEGRAHLGYVAQKFSLYGNLTGRQNMAFFGGAYGLSGRRLQQAMARAVDGLRLQHYLRRNVAELPLGIKQRLALACAILHGPSILFLDEPTSGVDPLTRREFWRHINDLAAAGVTVLVTTHFLDEAEYCDRVALMQAGRLIALGPQAELKAAQAGPELPDPTLEDAFIAYVRAGGPGP